MTVTLNFWPTFAFAVVMLSSVAFVIAFAVRQQLPSPPESKREPQSIAGIIFQGLSYIVIWTFHRQPFTPIIGISKAVEISVALLTMIVAVASVWFFNAAIRTLGKQWSLTARVVEGHKLVTEGPYSLVRNPIYTAMLGMLLATGLAISHWLALMIAIVLLAVGTAIRIRSEEKLLRNAFGGEFEAYVRQVPAILPFII